MLRIFLAHAKEDKIAVVKLYQQLKSQGYHPWLDKEDLLPGQNWRVEIPKAIRNSHVFIACLSQRSVAKQGYVQREFRMALNAYADKPPGSIYLIPLRLDDCEVPDLRQEEYGVNLRDLQWVDLFEHNGFERLLRALEYGFPDTHSSPKAIVSHLPETTLDADRQKGSLKRPNPEQKRWAFLVGINRYSDQSFSQLKYCVNDVVSLETLLNEAGYTVVCMHDKLPARDAHFPRYGYIKAEFQKLNGQFEPSDLLFVYFACHGICGSDRQPRLVAEDTRAETLTETTIAVADIRQWMHESGAGQLVLMLDACHQMKQSADKGEEEVISEFLKEMHAQISDGLALLALNPTELVAREFGGLEHGDFGYYILRGLAGAAKKSDSKQVTVGSLKRYVLDQLMQVAESAGLIQQLRERVTEDLSVKNIVLVEDKAFSISFITTPRASIPNLSLHTVCRPTFEFKVVTVDEDGKEKENITKQASYRAEELSEINMLDLVVIPTGRFIMGSPETELERQEDEGPQHEVTVNSFLMSKYPITQAQWEIVSNLPGIHRQLPPRPSYFKGDDRPVEMVSWYEVMEFCQRLSKTTGQTYRLPSEAEWEYACRAGTVTPYHFGHTITSSLANYNGELVDGIRHKGVYRRETTQVGMFQLANAFGLYDMHGNVLEWCLDHWHDSYNDAVEKSIAWTENGNSNFRLLRGGAWSLYPRYCRSANRGKASPEFRSSRIGFRIACSSVKRK